MAGKNKDSNYKFKSLKSFRTRDANTFKQKYQAVFIASQTDWITCELAFYNILFDEEDWKCKVKIECYERVKNGDTLFYDKEEEITVSKEDNICYYKLVLGRKDKTYWRKGHYTWKAYIDNTEVGKCYFYSLGGGEVTPEHNPYFDIKSIRFFNDGIDASSPEDRKYYTQFKEGDATYIHTLVTVKNKQLLPWMCELRFNYYTDNGMLITSNTRLGWFDKKEEEMFCAWGNSSGTTWVKGKYTVEVLFMDIRVAVASFTVGEDWQEGEPTVSASREIIIGSKEKPKLETDEKELDELMQDFDRLIGLSEIKTQIRNYVGYFQYEKLREEKGLAEKKEIKAHSVFMGNPGTGKTTVAKKLGKIYKALGLLSKGHVHEVDRADLIGEYIGHTAPKMKEAISRARGGILFIDEAYSLAREDSPRDFGHEAIEILLKEMSDGQGNLIVLVAGYPKEMKTFINSNPGLESRFSHYFSFPDYVPEELMQIAQLGLEKRNLSMTDEASDYLSKKLVEAYRNRDRSFGNARYVMSLIDESKMNLALRVMKGNNASALSEHELSTITLPDIRKIFNTKGSVEASFKIDKQLLQQSLTELDRLVGMDNIKIEIRDLVKLVTYYHEIGRDVLNQFVLHTVFVGNPGTGKTTVARIFARVFKALGIIEKGHLVECDREALVSSYRGDTARKTSELVDSAIGGVLFIDEAYSLSLGDNDVVGAEAINTLLKRMEDRNKEFIVIAAGYTRNMDEFLKSNPGLRSRFERVMHFEDFSTEELLEIAWDMFQMEGLEMDEDAEKQLREHFEGLGNKRDEYFGNGRHVRNVVHRISQQHNLRMADMDPEERDEYTIRTITKEDIHLPEGIEDRSSRRPIGFR